MALLVISTERYKMATTYITLVNDVLRRLNEVTLDIAGDGFDSVRNVQALAKDAVNNSIRLILQDGQEWPFLKTTYTYIWHNYY